MHIRCVFPLRAGSRQCQGAQALFMATLPLRFGALLTAIVGLILLPAHAWAVAATSSPVVASVPANPQQQRTIDELQTTSQGELVVQTHPTIGTIRLIQVAPGGDLLATWQSPSVHIDQLRRQQPNDLDLLHAKVEAFFATHGALTGLTNAVTTMRETESRRDAYGYTHIAYLQQYHDVPIFGGMVRTHFDNQGRLIAINGGALPADVMPLQKLNPLPTLTRENAVAQAIAAQQSAMAAAQTSEQATLTAATVTLYIYQIGLVQGVPGPIHLAYRVEVVNLSRTVREYIFVDAHTGAILDQFSAIYTLEREVSEGNLPNVVWDEGAGHPEPIPSGWAGSNSAQRQAWNDEITGAKETYNLFGSLTNGSWLSYSGQNAIMRTVNNDPTIQCPNANWDGVSANYCNGTTADDVVAHEWAHAYTEQTSGLIYAWQPGALNESFSDVWGETVDLLNGRGTDIHNGQRTANSCSTFSGLGGDNSTRWLAGEDAFGFPNVLRDMWTPTCHEHPGKVSDGVYFCATDDAGGVHVNSGVPNHLFALLVDGGTYNGRTVNAIGLTRAAHLYWRTQTTYLTPVSDFSDLANGLTAACTDLIGQSLYSLKTSGAETWGAVSTDKMRSTDCDAVAAAIAAVELRTPPTQCAFKPLLDPNPPALCTSPQQPVTLVLESWENGLGQWQVGRSDLSSPSQFSIPNWSVVANLPGARTGHAAFGPDPLLNGDQCQTIDESGVIYLQSPPLTLPSYTAAIRVAFDHWMASEAGFDGGVVQFRVNRGAWTAVPKDRFFFNAYNDSLHFAAQGNTNPLAGAHAFTGANDGSAQGSWGRSALDLTGLAGPGNTLELRFAFGLDGCNGLVGWYVDDIRTYTCAAPNDLAIRQAVNVTNVLPGQPVTFRLYVDNKGQVPTTNVTVANPLPATLELLNSTQSGPFPFTQIADAPDLAWHIEQIVGQLTGSLVLNTKVKSSLNQDQTILNRATIAADNDGTTNNNSAEGSVTLVVPRLAFAATSVQTPEKQDAQLQLTLDRVNPYADVTVNYSVNAESAQAGSDYIAAAGELTVRSGLTGTVLTIPVLDDRSRESNETFQVMLANAKGAQLTAATATVTILDDDHPGIDVTPMSGITDEDGGTAKFMVSLRTKPSSVVTLLATSADPSEGSVSGPLTFTPANWESAQSLTVTGVDDGIDDGSRAYEVALTVTSNDGEYAALTVPSLALVNHDNDVAQLGLHVSIAQPGPLLGAVVTYTYEIRNSGSVTLSALSAQDSFFGALSLPATTLSPAQLATVVLTRTTVVSDIVGALEQDVVVSALSAGGRQLTVRDQPRVTLLDVGMSLTATVGIAGVTDPCAGASTMRVPTNTTISRCYRAHNSGALTLARHTVSDDQQGILVADLVSSMVSGADLIVTTTALISADAVVTVTWRAAVDVDPATIDPTLTSLPPVLRRAPSAVTLSSAADDQDNDTIPDNVEGAADPDGDKIPNYLDVDADGDTIPDREEVGADPTNPRDSNNNGLPDYLEFGRGFEELFLPLIRR